MVVVSTNVRSPFQSDKGDTIYERPWHFLSKFDFMMSMWVNVGNCMEIQDFVGHYKNHPVLFIGTVLVLGIFKTLLAGMNYLSLIL